MAEPGSISDAQVALLGLLGERPMHAWEIERTAKHRDMRSWTDLSTSTIYKHLSELERHGHVASREEVSGGRLRKVYSVTEQGEEALRSRLRELLSEPQRLKWRVDLATYNIDLLPADESIACLETYRRRLSEAAHGYSELDAYLDGAGCSLHRRAVARRPLHLIEGEMRWVDEFLDELSRSFRPPEARSPPFAGNRASCVSVDVDTNSVDIQDAS
jgi:DNA-binding PadR family transcriptional regulator